MVQTAGSRIIQGGGGRCIKHTFRKSGVVSCSLLLNLQLALAVAVV